MQKVLSKLYVTVLIVLAVVFVLPRFVYKLPQDSNNSGVYFSTDRTSCYLLNINGDKRLIVYTSNDSIEILFYVNNTKSEQSGDLYSCNVISQNNTNLSINDSYDIWIKRINDTCFKINSTYYYKERLNSRWYNKGVDIYNSVIVSSVKKGDIKE